MFYFKFVYFNLQFAHTFLTNKHIVLGWEIKYLLKVGFKLHISYKVYKLSSYFKQNCDYST